MKQFFLLILFSTLPFSVYADSVYLQPEEFISQSFAGEPPSPSVMYLKGSLRTQIKSILGHNYSKIRIRYWMKGERSVWILEEIGKERPITTGIVVNGEGIERVKILIFRESRGWEVRHDFFTDQYTQAGLGSDHELDTQIDNITGATLSVRAVNKLTRMALLLHQHVADSRA